MKNIITLLKITTITAIIIAWCGVGKTYGQETKIIETGSNSQSQFPCYHNWEYSYSQQIYTSSELSAAGLRNGSIIYSIAFQKTSGGNNFHKVNNWDVYLINTNKNNFTDEHDFISINEESLVFSGEVNITNAAGWVTIDFTTPFEYTGGDLCVAVDENSEGYDATINWLCSTTTNYQSLMCFADGFNPDPYNPNNVLSSKPTFLRQSSKYRVNLQITFDVTNYCNALEDLEATFRYYTTPYNEYGLPDGWLSIYRGTDLDANPKFLTDDFYNKRHGDSKKISFCAGGTFGDYSMVIFPERYNFSSYLSFHTWLSGAWSSSGAVQILTFGYTTDFVNGSDFVVIGNCQKNQNGYPTSFNEFGEGTSTSLPTLPPGARYALKYDFTICPYESGSAAFVSNICASLPPCYDFTPELSASRTSINCTNPSTTLSVDLPSATYAWSTGATTQEITVSPTTTTTYTVTVSQGSCSTTLEQVITVDKTTPSATITAPSSEITCNNTSITLTAAGGTQYNWGSGFSATATKVVTAGGTYTVTVKGANGCEATASITIEKNLFDLNVTLVSKTDTTHLDCKHPVDTLVATVTNLTNTSNVHYLWLSPTDEHFVSSSSSGTGDYYRTHRVDRYNDATYKVIASTTTGCGGSATLNITVDKRSPYARIKATVPGTEYICEGGTFGLTAE